MARRIKNHVAFWNGVTVEGQPADDQSARGRRWRIGRARGGGDSRRPGRMRTGPGVSRLGVQMTVTDTADRLLPDLDREPPH
jgi:hypothetical protein